jgi:hypothetical protein
MERSAKKERDLFKKRKKSLDRADRPTGSRFFRSVGLAFLEMSDYANYTGK